MKSKRIERRKSNKPKKNNKIIYILILLFIIIGILPFTVFKKNITTQEVKATINLDEQFHLEYNSANDNFFTLVFTLNKDNTLSNNLFLYQNKLDKFYEVPIDRYVKYDDKYYLLENIYNVIKQNRAESASTNFIKYIENLVGIKISSYIYNFSTDYNTHYANDKNKDWQKYLVSDKNAIKLDQTKEIIFDSKNIKIYDEEQNDYKLRNDNTMYKNIKIELYNSTNLSGHGNTYSRLLQNSGFSVVRVLNYDTVYPSTTIYTSEGSDINTDLLKQLLNANKVDSIIPSDINTVADYVVILGGNSINLY